jgi:hypothetical protein
MGAPLIGVRLRIDAVEIDVDRRTQLDFIDFRVLP